MEYEVTVGGTPLVIEAGDDATVGALRAALEVPVLYLGGERLTDDRRLVDTPLAAGVALDGQPSTVDFAGAVGVGRELAVVGGLAAGPAVPLPPPGWASRLTVGRAAGCDLVLADAEVSRWHAEFRTHPDGTVSYVDCGSRNGTEWGGYRIDGQTPVGDGDVLRLGESMVSVRPRAPADARLESDPAHGVRRFNRPPRIAPPRRRPELAVPAAPDKPRGFRFPLATVLIPLVLAGVIYLVVPASAFFLIFLAFSPVMAIAYFITERRSGRAEYKEKLKAYHAELLAVRAQLNALASVEEHSARAALPDPCALVRIATGPTGRLFERRPGDDDFGRLRIGLVDRPVDVRLTGGGAGTEPLPTVYAVPVAVDLTAAGVVGVAGPRAVTLPIVRALLAQLATLHAPHDLGVVLLTGADEATDWEWASWLPHTVPHRADLACRRLVATDRAQAEARIAELHRLVAEWQADGLAGLRDLPTGRRMLVVLDGARRLRGLPGLADLLSGGPGLGVSALCLDQTELELPDECRATVVADGTRVRVSCPGQDAQAGVLPDGLTGPLADRIARALASVRVLGARLSDDGDLPDRVRYLDLAGLSENPAPDEVLARWAGHRGGRSTEALIGVGATGPVTVDIRRDGPHALIAGTSGAGKSELLQTLVASLALGNAPDALNLVLVDYKGGSAFADCRDLPHCVGLVTDLDGHLAARALASLSAELRRRESILAAAGAKDIEDYWARTGGRLPRLVIVVDEFATLVEEVPEFVTGVVGIGMRGRSLGVHVVLATQRPGGVVNAEMRANVNLRLCLRVTRGEESTDVVEVPDAARISRLHPGRGYLRTGHRDLATVQCARIGWPRTASAAPSTDVRVSRRRVTELGRPHVAVTTDGLEPGSGHAGDTDLTHLVAAIRAAADRAGLRAPAGPWLPALPPLVARASLPSTVEGVATAVLGLADHPTSQAQRPFTVDLDETGPVVVAGIARSGRSTALRTLAASLAAGASPADVHLYALDYGSRALAPVAGLPHCGAHVDSDEPDRVERLLDLLTAEVTRRARVLAAGGYGSVREQRAAVPAPARLPYLVLLVDRYETFLARHAEVDGGRVVEVLDGLLRLGPAAGVLPVLTTDRSGFTHRLGSAVATRLVLRQAEPDDLAVFGVSPREAPRSMPPGRAVVVPAGVEVQIAVLAGDPEGAAQSAAVEDLAAALTARWDGLDAARLPRRIDPLPLLVTMTELAALRPPTLAGPPPTRCTVGAGGDHLAPVDLDLAEAGATFLICGPPRSGRSTALAAIVASLAGRSTGELPVLLCCPRPSPLTGLAHLPGVVDAVQGAELWLELDRALGEHQGPVALVVDDAELLAEGPAADVLERFVRTARDDGNVVVAAGTTDDLLLQRYRGWLAGLRRGRHGLLLDPSSYVDGEVLDVRLPRSTSGGWPPGRALLVARGATLPIQVPLLDMVGAGGCAPARPEPIT